MTKPTFSGGPAVPETLRPANRRHPSGLLLNSLIIMVCVVAVIGIWLSTLQRISFEEEQARDAARRSNANLAIAYEQEIYRTLKAAEQVAAFARAQYQRYGTRLNLLQWARDHVIRDEAFTILSIVDADGFIVDSTDPVGQVNYEDREFFLAQKQDQNGDHLYINRPVLGRVSGEWRIPMSLGIWEESGRFDGVVVLSVSPRALTGFYGQIDLGANGLLEVTGLDGIIRARQTGGHTVFGLKAKDLPWFQRQAGTPQGVFLDDGRTTDGVQRIISYRTLANYPLMVVVGTDYADVLAPAKHRRSEHLWNASTATLALLGYSALLIFLLARARVVSRALEASEERLAHAALHDPLTGLPNRVMFGDQCDRAVAAARRHDEKVGVLYVDLDSFKTVNDRHGHAAGDHLLQQVARRLESCIRAGSEDLVSRFGGDEFGIVLVSLASHNDCEQIAGKILTALNTPFDLDGTTVHISASIGAALYPDHGNDTNTLVQLADEAMYAAKKAGKNRFSWGALATP